MKLWYNRPAASWTEALPAGNGRLGAMLVGNPENERVYLNEDTFWSGYPRKLENVCTVEAFQKIRDLIIQRRYQDAENLIEKEMSFQWGESYEPLGNLKLDFDDGEISDYRRELNLDEALLTVNYTASGVKHVRELLVSAPQQVMAMRLTADAPCSVSFALSMDGELRHEIFVEQNRLWMKVQAPSNVEPSYRNDKEEPVFYSNQPDEQGMRAWVAVEVRHDGGELTAEGDALRLQGANSAVVLLAAHTSFRRYNLMPDIPDEEVRGMCAADLEGVSDYEALRAAHVKDHRRYMERVEFALEGESREDLPTDERIRSFDPENPDVGLYPMLFQYGRYLMIAGSRPGTQATNLQGIWNKEVRPPWSSNYTININTQMNYWPALSCGLEEMQLPLIDLVKDLAENGREMAEQLYGAGGFVSHHNTDLWRFTWPVGNHVEGSATYGFWNMSGAWLCQQVFERYEYTLDKEYLRDTAWPILRSAAEFMLNMLIEDEDGSLIVSPATSPENQFLADGKTFAVDRTSAMSMALAREVFGNCVKACEILEENADFAEELRSAIAKLRPNAISESGRLIEWYDDHPEREVHHRHLSHLYGVHPGNHINAEDTPELMAACRKSLEVRGDEGTGWSLAWKVCQWARHGEGERALRVLNMQLRLVSEEATVFHGGGSYANLFCAHPPFQIDGNFGVVAGIAEMLLQSREDRILLLPALPKAWAKGCISGLRARGQVQAEIAWNGEEGCAGLTSGVRRMVRISVGRGQWIERELVPGEELVLKWRGDRFID